MLIYSYKVANTPRSISNPPKGYCPSTDPSTDLVAYTHMHVDVPPPPLQPEVQVPGSLPFPGEDEGTPALHASVPAPQLLTLVRKPPGGSHLHSL